MPPNTIICDWNGTLIEYRSERPLFEHIATELFWASLPFRPLRAARILRTRERLEEFNRDDTKNDVDLVREMFRVYNDRVIRGVPVSLIRKSVAAHANSARTQAKLDYRVLRPVRDLHQAGRTTGILSAGYQYGIEKILAVAGCDTYFDFCVADGLAERDGKAIGFRLDMYTRKHEYLQRLLSDWGLDAREVAYIGDSEDDEGCFEIAGYPVVSFLAPQELKDRFAERYRAFVPRDEKELGDFLNRA